MLVAFAASVVAMAVDHREILGAPTWLKPAKFAISSAIYAFTLAWIFTCLPGAPPADRRRRLDHAVVLVLEVGIIDLQAARGVTSHFNVGTPARRGAVRHHGDRHRGRCGSPPSR